MSQTAVEARDAGIAVAVEHADRVHPSWRERAYDALVAYAATHPTFTIEQLRADVGATLEDPPSQRAWGGIAQRAQRAGLIEHHGWTQADNPACHCGEVRIWRRAGASVHDTRFARHRTPTLASDDAAWLRHPQTLESKRQWDQVARLLGADPDNIEAVFIRARIAGQMLAELKEPQR